MSGLDREQPVEVPIGDCLCSGDPRPHPDGDLVWLRAKPDLAMGLAATTAIRQNGANAEDLEAALGGVFVRYGVSAWNVLDENGKPVPVTFSAIAERLAWAEGGALVADRAADLYTNAVIAPLVTMSARTQPPTHRNGSTSANRRSGRSPRSSRRPSSPSGPVAST